MAPGSTSRGGTTVGRIAGVPIQLNPTWPVSLAVVVAVVGVLARRLLPDPSLPVTAVAALVLTLLLMAGVLVHELGHLWAARLGGQRVLRIRFDVLGGQTELIGPGRGAGADAFVAIAGPLASAAFAGAGFLAAQAFTTGTLPHLTAVTVGVVNALLTVFNLLPAIPLDGGEVVRTVAWRLTGNRRTGLLVGYLCTVVIVAGLLGLAAARWVAGESGRLQAVVLAAMAIHLGVSALVQWRAERIDSTGPRAVPNSSSGSARPIVEVPVASTLADARAAVAGALGTGAVQHRPVVLLVHQDGAVAGIAELADWDRLQPGTPVVTVAAPHSPLALLLTTDGPSEISAALQRHTDQFFLAVDEQGQVCGVWSRDDLTRILEAS